MTACRSSFHGAPAGEWRSDLFALSETHYGRRFRTPRHSHDGATLAFVLRGGFVEKLGSRHSECGAGTLLLRPHAIEHEDTFFDGETHCFNITLPAEAMPAVSGAVIDGTVGAAAWAAQRIVVAARRAGPHDPLALECAIAELVGAVAHMGTPKRMSATMARVSKGLRETFARRWSLGMLAEEAQVHPVHFARSFRQAHGESLGQQVHRLRIEFAATQMARTGLPLAEIALAAGFSDQAHFSRVFRRTVGETPSRFRAAFGRGRTLRSFKTR